MASLEKPLSLAFTVTDKRSKGRWGSAHPPARRVSWPGIARKKKPLELSCDRYREPDQGALGQCPPRQGDVSLGLASLKKVPGAPLFNLSKPKSTKSHVQSFPDGTSNRLPLTDPPPGFAVESRTYPGTRHLPRPAAAPRTPWMFGPNSLFNFVVFPTPEFLQGLRPARLGQEGRDLAGQASRRRGHGVSNPPLVTPRSQRLGGSQFDSSPARKTCLWAWRCSKKPLELSCDRYREPDQGALG
ncbi:hypothetical protein G5714_024549 [Onychostoma macrolepis]|uniref:Uncharacterized protein n=1 Tax=Onychostoma macrolepis TaxID=369639 RepID=A0A7J6BLF7_9TELE|nr:hypothetical protein G5714_024549 [Onychostoma macrolepis]